MAKPDETQPQGKRRSGRADAPGMKRTSLYISEKSAEAFDDAIDQVLSALGPGTPRHVAVSALIAAGAKQVDTVTRDLIEAQTAELSQRLATLKAQQEK